jgi:hypothetical protein
MRDKRGEIE